jgi:hypothetical protein
MVVARENSGVGCHCAASTCHTNLLFSQFELAERVAAGGVRAVEDLGVSVKEQFLWQHREARDILYSF